MHNAGGWDAGTITEAFELIADGQPIEACYIGQLPDRGWLPVAPTPPRTGLLDWDEAALYHLGNRTTGTYYDLHVELAEQLDPRCGPADGGSHRAAMRRDETRARTLAASQGAA